MHKKYAKILFAASLVLFVYFNVISPIPAVQPTCSVPCAAIVTIPNPLNWEIPVAVGFLAAFVYAFGGRLEGEE